MTHLLHREFVKIANMANSAGHPELICELFECDSLFEVRERLSQVRAKAEADISAAEEWQRGRGIAETGQHHNWLES